MTFALAAVPLLALTSAAVEYSRVTKERSKVSSALDAAVLAAANNNSIPLDQKDSYAETHFLANYSGDMTFELQSNVTASRVRLEANGELELSLGHMVSVFWRFLKKVETRFLLIEISNSWPLAVPYIQTQMHQPLSPQEIISPCQRRVHFARGIEM